MPATEEVQAIEELMQSQKLILAQLKKVIVGQEEVINQMLMALFAGGHCLLEGVPGLAKTLMIKTLANVLNLKFKRIQFTPDLMPADITGTDVLEEDRTTGHRTIRFIQGPIFANILLADEINRTPPKTQAALLEAMQEYHVTAGGNEYQLQQPFFVLATQNPIEYEGTFPLPEAQVDRFLMRIRLGYPAPNEELAVLGAQQYRHPIENMSQVVSVEELGLAQKAVREIYVAEELKRYIIELVNATRQHADVYLGSSPRGSLALFRCAQARAAMADREFVIPDDVKALAEVTLAHRVIVGPSSRIRDISSRSIVQEIVSNTPVPGASTQ